MKLINFKTELNINECENFLNSRIISKDDIGINWLYSQNKKVLFYYEDGTVDSRGSGFKLLKSYFWGRVRIKDQQPYLSGIIFSGPFTTILAIVQLIYSLWDLFKNNSTGEFVPIFLFILLLVWVHIGERKNRKSIEEYLHRVF